jgi:polysaccharide biosynthesis/export protein
MDWLNQHLRLTLAILSVVFLTLVPGEQVSAQQGRPVPLMPSESGRPSTPGSGLLSTPGMRTAGSDTVPSPGSQSPKPFRAPEMPPLSPESPQPTPVVPTPVTPTPGERKPERNPTRSLDRPERPAGAAALPSRSPIEQIFGGDPLQSKLSRDLRQFGYDLFREPVSTFAPVTDVPVGPEYILGPGDVMQAYLWGMVDNVLPLQVNRQGEIFVPRVGTIPVWGLPLGEVRRVIHDQLSREYAGFRMSLNSSTLRSIQVFVVGEVAQPGAYTVSSLSTMVHALFAAGELSKLGSLRTIRLIRNNRTIGTLDLYDFLLS